MTAKPRQAVLKGIYEALAAEGASASRKVNTRAHAQTRTRTHAHAHARTHTHARAHTYAGPEAEAQAPARGTHARAPFSWRGRRVDDDEQMRP